MEIQLTDKDLANIIHAIKVETAKEIERYLHVQEEAQEDGVVLVEVDDMYDYFMDFTPTTKTVFKIQDYGKQMDKHGG